LRVFHWSLVATVTAAIVTGEIGGPWMVWHGRAGLTIVGLLVFRVVWGVVGSPTSRFANFAPSPRKVVRYLRGQWRGVGHNPLGALSVFALLGLLALQAGTGLFGNDDIAFTGPLNHLVDDSLGGRLTGWHRLLANALFVLMGLHLCAIAFYTGIKRHKLVKPMISGVHDVEAGTPLPAPARQGGSWALPLAVTLAAAGVLAIARAGPGAGPAPAPEATPPVPAAAKTPAAKAAPGTTAAPSW